MTPDLTGGMMLPEGDMLQQLMGSSKVVGGVYTPDENDQKLIADTKKKLQDRRIERQVHEQEWFISAAMFRGNHYVEWNDKYQRLTVPKAPPHRVRLKINRLQAKVRARLSKFLKNRPKPLVIPATAEWQDYLNAKATQRVLDYLWRKLRLEPKFRDAMQIAMICGKAFWWFHWDPKIKARMQQINELGQPNFVDQEMGDVSVEVGSPFEVLVADPGIPDIGSQPEIMRLKMRDVDDMKARYPDFADVIVASSGEESLFTYEKQIAGLNPYTYTTGGRSQKDENKVLVCEHFFRPCGTYPNGHYRVLVGEILVKAEDSLPYDFQDMGNPYPVVEFYDIKVPGQFWCTTLTSQMTDLQREYNLMRSKLAENLRLMAHPKLLVAKQHQLQKSAWTSEAGEIVEYVGVPGLPPPTPWNPANVAADLWRNIELLQKEFDDVPQIYPSSEGKAGQATSGFQTNLLQEATDSVHGPDIRLAELAIEEAAFKIRRLCKMGYDIPRLISAVGTNYQAEVFEFSADQIDEMADVIVEVGSALPTLKAAKQEAVMNLYKSGLYGDPADPLVRKFALGLLEMGSAEEGFDMARADENQARNENKQAQELPPMDPMQMMPGAPPQFPQLPPPHFWENHQVHYNIHTYQLKSAEVKSWRPEQIRALVAHTILHARFINPQSALQIAMEEGIQEVVPMIMQMMQPPPGAPPGPPGPQGPQGPPPGPPPGPAGPRG